MKKINFLLPVIASIVALAGAFASTVKPASSVSLSNQQVHQRTPVSGPLSNCTTVTCSDISINNNPLCRASGGGDIYQMGAGGAQNCSDLEPTFKYKIPS